MRGVTALLNRARDNDRSAIDVLFELLYEYGRGSIRLSVLFNDPADPE